MFSTHTPPTVIVVGAGPAGLTTAIALVARAFHACRRASNRPFPVPARDRRQPSNDGTLRGLGPRGFRPRRGRRRSDHRMGGTYARVTRGRRESMGFPLAADAALLSPATGDHCPARPPRALDSMQYFLSLPVAAAVRLGTEWSGLSPDADGVTVTLREARRDVDSSCRLRDRRRRCPQRRAPPLGHHDAGPGRIWAPISPSSFTRHSLMLWASAATGCTCSHGRGRLGCFCPPTALDRWVFSMTWDPYARDSGRLSARASRRAHPLRRGGVPDLEVDYRLVPATSHHRPNR